MRRFNNKNRFDMDDFQPVINKKKNKRMNKNNTFIDKREKSPYIDNEIKGYFSNKKINKEELSTLSNKNENESINEVNDIEIENIQENKEEIKNSEENTNTIISLNEFIPKEEVIFNYNYCLYIHNKHNKDWSEKSWIRLLDFDNEEMIGVFIDTIMEYNTIDYDFYISKKNLIPIEENVKNHYRSDITISEEYKHVIAKFTDILILLFTNQIKYNIDFIGLIIKNNLCCIKIVSNPSMKYKVYNELNDNNYPIVKDILNKITDKPVIMGDITKHIYSSCRYEGLGHLIEDNSQQYSRCYKSKPKWKSSFK